MAGTYAKMTRAINKMGSSINSSLDYGYNAFSKLPRAFSGAKNYAMSSSGIEKRMGAPFLSEMRNETARQGNIAGLKGVGKSLGRSWQYGTKTQRAGMIGMGASAAAGIYGLASGATSLVNWGLGGES